MATLAGCATLTGSESLSQVELNSNSESDHTIHVTVLADDGTALFDRSFDLPSNMSNEGIDPFSGDPAEIVVQIDDAEPLRSEWPEHPTRLRANETPRTYVGEGCGSRPGDATVTGVLIFVVDSTWVGLKPTCNTVTPVAE